jgi:hypothetical protein
MWKMDKRRKEKGEGRKEKGEEGELVRHFEMQLKETDMAFRPFFSTRVMARIDSLRDRQISLKLFEAFQRIVVPGIAVILIFLMAIYFVHGSISLESIMGTETLSNENLSAFVIYE